jgi:transitional endoplasmic reticulum ATPase
LKVAEAYSNDVSRSVARIERKTMDALGLQSGDIVKVAGKKSAVARALLSHPADDGKDLVRIDGRIRLDASAGLGDSVVVSKVATQVATKVRVAPLENAPDIDTRYFLEVIDGFPVMNGTTLSIPYFGGRLLFRVADFAPHGEAVVVKSSTSLQVVTGTAADKELQVTYEDIGGMKDEVQKVREMIELPLRHPEIFDKLGVQPPKGVLLHGVPGTGKTLLAKAVAAESGAKFFTIGGPEIMSKFYGESEQKLRDIFKKAKEAAPSVIFIDELDSIAPKREDVSGEVEKRVVSQLLSLMDGLEGRGQVIVIATTNRPNSIDPALRRPGRFDREIEVKIPNRDGRQEILQIHMRHMPLGTDVDTGALAAKTHGYVGADLEYLCKEAAMKALRKVLPTINLENEHVSADDLDKIKVAMDDFDSAFNEIIPSAMREVYLETPDVKWADIGGLDGVKKELQEAVEWPLKYPELYSKIGYVMPKGMLMYGLPGVGKTLLAKAVATESEANFISVRGPEFISKWIGESEKGIREVFRKARQAAPCVIFFDEIDSIAPVRSSGANEVTERVVSQLLTEMDGMQSLKNVIVIAATNRVDIIDPALLRAGRFDRIIEVGLPDAKTREAIFKIALSGKHVAGVVDPKALAELTEGVSGADITNIVARAASSVIREFVSKYATPAEANKHAAEAVITMDHLKAAITGVSNERTQKVKAMPAAYG